MVVVVVVVLIRTTTMVLIIRRVDVLGSGIHKSDSAPHFGGVHASVSDIFGRRDVVDSFGFYPTLVLVFIIIIIIIIINIIIIIIIILKRSFIVNFKLR